MELCGRGRTIPEPDRLGQSVGSAPICLRPPILPPSTGCQPGTGPDPNRTRFRADSWPTSAYCATSCMHTQIYENTSIRSQDHQRPIYSEWHPGNIRSNWISATHPHSTRIRAPKWNRSRTVASSTNSLKLQKHPTITECLSLNENEAMPDHSRQKSIWQLSCRKNERDE